MMLLEVVGQALKVVNAAIEAETQNQANELRLIELMTEEQRATFLDFIIQDRARRSRNLDWLQKAADELGRFLDGSKLQELIDTLKSAGVDVA